MKTRSHRGCVTRLTKRRDVRRVTLELVLVAAVIVLFVAAIQTGVLTAFADWFGQAMADQMVFPPLNPARLD